MRWNHRGPGSGINPAHDRFDGIELQEWHPDRELTGPLFDIFAGTGLGLTEAPHLFRRDGWYYLTTAEGGTGYDHAVTMARSRNIAGPYEVHPDRHLLTARFDADAPLQRVGHGQYVETNDGAAYHTYLCGRPLPGPRGAFSALGRETGIARCVWREGWLYLDSGGQVPPVDMPGLPARKADRPIERVFTMDVLPDEFQWLRTPFPERLFTMTGAALCLTGRESLGSWFEQALVARRQEHHAYRAETEVLADPRGWQQAAGLITYYNRHKFHACLVTQEPEVGRCVRVVSCLGDWPGEALTLGSPVRVPDGPVRLTVEVDGAKQRFLANGMEVGPVLDASVISDEGGRGEHASFTGAFVGMVAHDLTGQGWSADFTRFAYAGAVQSA